MTKRVLVFGTFDVLHLGHRDFFRQARALGDELFVVVARDATVQKLKGFTTQEPEQERLRSVQQCPEVTNAQLGRAGDKYKVIEEIRPDIIALGYDQRYYADALPAELAKRGLSISIVRLNAYHPERYKSALLREKRHRQNPGFSV
jgi:FAD synthetase